MRKWLISALILSLGVLLPAVDGGGKKSKTDGEDPKEALQALQEFIGGWKGTANEKKLGFWTEKADWSWRELENPSHGFGPVDCPCRPVC